MTSAVRSVNVNHVNQLVEAVRIGGALDMEKLLRVASDIGGYTPETDLRYKPDGGTGEADEIERFEWVARWLGLKDPEAKVLFDLGGPRYTPSGITREYLLAVPGSDPRRGAGGSGYLAQERSGAEPVKHIPLTGRLVADNSAQILGTESLGTNEEAFAQIRWV